MKLSLLSLAILQCDYKVLTEGCYTSYELMPTACPPGYTARGVEVNNGTTLEVVPEDKYCKNPTTGESVIIQEFDPPLELEYANFSIEGWMYFDPSHERIMGDFIEFLNEDGEWEKRDELDCDHDSYTITMNRAIRESYEECFGVDTAYEVQPIGYRTIEYLLASKTDNVVCVPTDKPKVFTGQR